jgi:prepilin-type N-terminal cleavage/methylation domain-containing protein
MGINDSPQLNGVHPVLKKRTGFTLVELLIVVGISAVLIAILVPALANARRSANRTACRASLRDIGMRLQMYLGESKNHLPWVNTMPSVQPPLNDAPPLTVTLEPYTKGARESYRCPSDRITQPSPGSPAGFDTYYDREKSSYQYNPFLATFYGGQPITNKDIYKFVGGDPGKTVFVSDYEAFHGKPGSGHAMNALFMDMHVEDSMQPLQ